MRFIAENQQPLVVTTGGVVIVHMAVFGLLCRGSRHTKDQPGLSISCGSLVQR